MTSTRCKLITIPASHYCDRARWALDLAGLPYEEEKWTPVLHYLGTFAAGARKTVPVLKTPDGQTLADSSDILAYVDRVARGVELYPTDRALKERVLELESLFSRELGPATRAIMYVHAFADRRLSDAVLLDHDGMERWKKALFSAFFPGIKALMTQGMKLDAANAAVCLERVRRIFDTVGALIADGRRTLVGDRLTAADITFASMSAPLLLPEPYGVEIPSLKHFPPDYPGHALARTPAGQFALRIYAEHRRPGGRR